MKLTVLFLTVGIFNVCASGVSQTVSFSGQNVPLKSVLSSVEKQTGFVFMYTKPVINSSKPVSVSVQNLPLEQFLSQIFSAQPLQFDIRGKNIFLSAKSSSPQPSSGTFDALKDTLIDVKGRAVNELGDPVEGVSVSVKGSTIGATTNANGEFSLSNVNSDAILEFTSVNMEPFQINLKGRLFLDIKLQTRITSMQEVIINKGYYTESKKLATGNVFTIGSKDIEGQPVQNPLLALSGRVPGLLITQPSGLAGSSVKVRVQGDNSIVNGNEPLYIVDGVPIVSQFQRTGIDAVAGTPGRNFAGYGNPLNYINPSDIERIDVLKDADATAIYGSRAANGAILITTKKGKAGQMKIDLSMQTGWGDIARRMKMLNTRQYLDMRYEAYKNDGINWTASNIVANDLKVWDTTQYTDWQKELIGGTARYNDFTLSFSGGTSNLQYLLSGTFHHETTVFPYPKEFSDKKGNVHVSISANSNNKKFRLQFLSSFMSDRNQLPSEDITPYALLLEPNAPNLLNQDGSINWAPNAAGATTLSNANVMLQVYTPYKNKTNNLISNLTLSYEFFSGLKINTSIGYNWMNTEEYNPLPLISVRPELLSTSQRSARFGNRQLVSWIAEPQLSYSKNFRKSKIEALIGSTLLVVNNNSGFLTATGQLNDEMLESKYAASSITPNSLFADVSEYRYNALYGRFNYNWREKYILNFTARRDGSSRFGDANLFENFWSMAAAWIFSNESFIKLPFISFGKLRGSFGTTGSDQIGNFGFLSLYSLNTPQVPYQGITGLAPNIIPNPYLQWELTKKLQVGIDLGFFKDKLSINLTYAQNKSSNQLLSTTFPYTAGITTQPFNFPATVQNVNWEASINSVNLNRRGFSWRSNINLTIPRNKLIEFPDLATSVFANRLVIGEPISVTKSFSFSGVDPQTGVYLYNDKDKNVTGTPVNADRYLVINLDPIAYGGVQNTFAYKELQLDFLFQFIKQKGPVFSNWNGTRYPGEFIRGQSNQPVSVLDRWQGSSDITSVKKFSTQADIYFVGSNKYYSDASFVRLKHASLSWKLPEKWIKSAHLRTFNVFLRGQNLLTFTKYKGLDPETRSMTSLPPLRIWTIGINAGL